MADDPEQNWLVAFMNGDTITVSGVRWGYDGCGQMWLINSENKRVITLMKNNVLYYRPMATPTSNDFPLGLQLALAEMVRDGI